MSEQAPFSEDVLSVNRVMCKRVRELDLSARVTNYLENDGIVYVGDLVQKTEDEILRLPNFGRPRPRSSRKYRKTSCHAS
jgi:DNA-directed RNA polymerase subunit alpha